MKWPWKYFLSRTTSSCEIFFFIFWLTYKSFGSGGKFKWKWNFVQINIQSWELTSLAGAAAVCCFPFPILFVLFSDFFTIRFPRNLLKFSFCVAQLFLGKRFILRAFPFEIRADDFRRNDWKKTRIVYGCKLKFSSLLLSSEHERCRRFALPAFSTQTNRFGSFVGEFSSSFDFQFRWRIGNPASSIRTCAEINQGIKNSQRRSD